MRHPARSAAPLLVALIRARQAGNPLEAEYAQKLFDETMKNTKRQRKQVRGRPNNGAG